MSIAGSHILHGSLMPLNTRASFTLSTPSMAGCIAGLLQSSLQMAVIAICYFPMISWWLAYITVNICWKNIHAHNMLFLRLTKSRALFYLTPTWYDVCRPPGVPILPNPRTFQRKVAWQLQVVPGSIRRRRTIDDRSHVTDVLFRRIQ